jgi:hypothetical protein
MGSEPAVRGLEAAPHVVAPHEFHRTDELFGAGYRTATNLLEELQVDGPGIYGHPHFHGPAAEAAIAR